MVANNRKGTVSMDTCFCNNGESCRQCSQGNGIKCPSCDGMDKHYLKLETAFRERIELLEGMVKNLTDELNGRELEEDFLDE